MGSVHPFSHAIKATAALIVAAGTFGILHGILTSLTKGYVQRMRALWVAKTGGTMIVRIEDKAIKDDAEKGGTLFLCSDVTSVVRSKSHVAYVVSDQQKRMTAFLPVPLCERSFIDAMNQHLRPQVLAKAGDRSR